MLLKRGANCYAGDVYGVTPLSLAAALGRQAMERLLETHPSRKRKRPSDNIDPKGQPPRKRPKSSQCVNIDERDDALLEVGSQSCQQPSFNMDGTQREVEARTFGSETSWSMSRLPHVSKAELVEVAGSATV
ncbi:hypothetical protein PV11_08891 [Exophiala sideris]|uniref:Uncharacterized protein n=1 Tax=Exophiala sideris TaxID=1016849 RepID=A0A0D1VM70_9EURO|nr:hypothetical protein PV11_08891 [Exophiala sideris]